ELLQSRPAGVGFPCCARALALIEIGAAIRAQPSAILAAHPGHRDGEFYLLAHYVVEVQAIIPIERDEQIVLAQLSFFGRLQTINRRDIEEVKTLVNVDPNRGKAPCAIELDRRRYSPGQSEFIARAGRPRNNRRGPEDTALLASKPRLLVGKHVVNIEPFILADLADVNLH